MGKGTPVRIMRPRRRLPSHQEDDLEASQETRDRLADEIKELVSQRKEINKRLADLRAQKTAASDRIHRLISPGHM